MVPLQAQLCRSKLHVMTQQRDDLCEAFSLMLERLVQGQLVLKHYRQVKMYNDPYLNPVICEAILKNQMPATADR
jgi:hypothetical protein